MIQLPSLCLSSGTIPYLALGVNTWLRVNNRRERNHKLIKLYIKNNKNSRTIVTIHANTYTDTLYALSHSLWQWTLPRDSCDITTLRSWSLVLSFQYKNPSLLLQFDHKNKLYFKTILLCPRYAPPPAIQKWLKTGREADSTETFTETPKKKNIMRANIQLEVKEVCVRVSPCEKDLGGFKYLQA